jgi:hypothetical protein
MLPLITIRMLVAAAVVLAVAGLAAAGGFWLAGHGPHVDGGAVAVLGVAGAGGALLWARSARRHPWRRCLRCSTRRKGDPKPAAGSGRHVDRTLFKGTSGRCRCCQGRGQHPRVVVRVFQPGRARDLVNGKRGKYG